MAKKASYLVDLSSIQLDDNPESTELWIQAMPLGTYQHPEYGTIDINPSKVKQFVSNIKDNVRMQQLDIDYDHKRYDGSAAGWVKDAEDRGADGLWLLVDWTQKAFQAIKDKAYRYFSAEFDDEWTDNQGKSYSNVIFGGALTNRPFLKNMLPINFSEVFANVPPAKSSEGGSPMSPEQVKSLGIKLGLGESATEAQVLEALEKVNFQTPNNPPAPPAPPVNPPNPPAPPVNPPAPQPVGDPSTLAILEEAKKLAENNPAMKTMLALYTAQSQLVQDQGNKLAEQAKTQHENNVKSTVKELFDGYAKKGYAVPIPMRDNLTNTLLQLNDPAISKVILDGFTQMADAQVVALGERGYLRNRVNDDGQTPEQEFTTEVRKLMEADKNMTFADAAEAVSIGNPDLYRRHQEAAYAFGGEN